VKWRWRPGVVAAVASVLVAGCGSELQSSESSQCIGEMTTSPDWVFSLTVSAGGIAFFSVMFWCLFIPGLFKHAPKPPAIGWPPRGWAQWALMAFLVLMVANLAYTQYTYRDMWTQTPEVYFDAAFVSFGILVTGGSSVAARKHRATGTWPSGRQAPWGFFWVLPVIFLVAASATGWALATMAASVVSTGPC
jgi:hypothetical protein